MSVETPADVLMPFVCISDESMETAVGSFHGVTINSQTMVPEVELRHIARNMVGAIPKTGDPDTKFCSR